MKNQSGFTFIEIIVVLVIIGIIAAIAVPKFVNLTDDAKRAAADATVGAMKSATSLAFAKHRAAKLVSSGTGDNAYITDADTLENWMDGGFPEGVSSSGSTVTLQDSRTATINAETNDNRATISVE